MPLVSGIVYPVVVSWTWGSGWLYQIGYVDFAGSSVVHLAGATCALVLAVLVGPRTGKFSSSKV